MLDKSIGYFFFFTSIFYVCTSTPSWAMGSCMRSGPETVLEHHPAILEVSIDHPASVDTSLDMTNVEAVAVEVVLNEPSRVQALPCISTAGVSTANELMVSELMASFSKDTKTLIVKYIQNLKHAFPTVLDGKTEGQIIFERSFRELVQIAMSKNQFEKLKSILALSEQSGMSTQFFQYVFENGHLEFFMYLYLVHRVPAPRNIQAAMSFYRETDGSGDRSTADTRVESETGAKTDFSARFEGAANARQQKLLAFLEDAKRMSVYGRHIIQSGMGHVFGWKFKEEYTSDIAKIFSAYLTN